MNKKFVSIGLKDLSKSNRLMLNILMQEIADVRRELKEDIHELDVRLSGKIDTLSSDLHTLRLEVHTNHATFILNHADLDKRVTVLEMAA